METLSKKQINTLLDILKKLDANQLAEIKSYINGLLQVSKVKP